MHYLRQVTTVAEPSATNIERDFTGQTARRDDQEEILYLLLDMNKRRMHIQYCKHCRKMVVTSDIGKNKLVDIEGVD